MKVSTRSNVTNSLNSSLQAPRGVVKPTGNSLATGRSTFETTGRVPGPVLPAIRAAVDIVKQKLSELGVAVTPRTLAQLARLTVAAAAANPDATSHQLASLAAEQLVASERERSINRTLKLLAAQFKIPSGDKGALAAFVREQAEQVSALQLLANVETPLAQLDLLPFGAIADYCEKQGWPTTGASNPVTAAFD